MCVLQSVPAVGAGREEVVVAFPLVMTGVKQVLLVVESYAVALILLLCAGGECSQPQEQNHNDVESFHNCYFCFSFIAFVNKEASGWYVNGASGA